MSKILIGISVLLLTLSAILGVLNGSKNKTLRAEAMRSETARVESERLRSAREKEFRTREAATADARSKPGDDPAKIANSEAELVRSQAEKQELQAKLRANETEIAELKQRIDADISKTVMPGAPSAPAASDLQAELADTKKQLDAAEREKHLLSDKIRAAQDRSATLEIEKKRRVAASGNPGIRGTILAVNQAYNFVVLNLGGRQGIEANSEMLVLRGGALIGKIRVSSVEPATAIGDIITSSLARGVQVQPGDTVIYAGSNS